VTERECKTTYEEECKNTVERECKTEYVEECETTTEKQCKTVQVIEIYARGPLRYTRIL
jgi:hypothetical protein